MRVQDFVQVLATRPARTGDGRRRRPGAAGYAAMIECASPCVATPHFADIDARAAPQSVVLKEGGHEPHTVSSAPASVPNPPPP